MSSRHIPVLCNEVVAAFQPLAGQVVVDATLGGAGHARALLAAGAQRVIGIERDPAALARLQPLPGLVTVAGNFRDLPVLLAGLELPELQPAGLTGGVDRILADLGYSSDQMDDPARGFGYAQEGPLDMRMHQGHGPDAATLLGTLSEAALAQIFRDYGEEPRARLLAQKVVRARRAGPLATTGQLRALVEELYPPRPGLARSHPAARAFQALRVAVNGELDDLQRFLPLAAALLAPGGRLGIITFNSLEDRLVKAAYRALAMPVHDAHGREVQAPPYRVWSKIVPTADEVAANRRARSAKLRVLEKLASVR